MKIIEQTQAFGWRQELQCTGKSNGNKGCNSILEVERADLRWYSPADTGGDAAVMFKCPVCGECTDINTTQWPRGHDQLTAFTRVWMDEPVEVSYEVVRNNEVLVHHQQDGKPFKVT